MSSRPGAAEMEVEQLSLTQLKNETVRLEREAKKIEERRAAVRERMNQIISENKKAAAAAAKKRSYSQYQEQHQDLPQQLHCRTEGCTAEVYKNGACLQHHKRPMCSVKGCLSSIQRAGLCEKHGDYIRKRCSVPGCNKQARKGGVCYPRKCFFSFLILILD